MVAHIIFPELVGDEDGPGSLFWSRKCDGEDAGFIHDFIVRRHLEQLGIRLGPVDVHERAKGFSPRGSKVLLRTTTLRSVEIQDSVLPVMGLSLSIMPGGYVIVKRRPFARIPSIILVPSGSLIKSGALVCGFALERMMPVPPMVSMRNCAGFGGGRVYRCATWLAVSKKY